jgi:2-keto-3-deoxy-L-fuconate dehydrogenase
MTRKTELAGKIAVITGAGSGIGSATARLLAARGAEVHLADLHADAAEAAARQIRQAGGTAETHTVDVADPAAVEGLAKAVYDADGRVDILHNNAGIAHTGNIEATTRAGGIRCLQCPRRQGSSGRSPRGRRRLAARWSR